MQKVKGKIQLNKEYSFNIIHRPDDPSVNSLKDSIRTNLSKLEDFYNFTIIELNIELLYTRKEFNELVGRKTPDWMIALSQEENIYIMSPTALLEHSSHNASELKKTIIHELVHIFNAQLNSNCPTWLDEGLALYLANQKRRRDFSRQNWQYFLKNHFPSTTNLDDFAAHEGYKISYSLVERILQKYDKDQVLNKLKNQTTS